MGVVTLGGGAAAPRPVGEAGALPDTPGCSDDPPHGAGWPPTSHRAAQPCSCLWFPTPGSSDAGPRSHLVTGHTGWPSAGDRPVAALALGRIALRACDVTLWQTRDGRGPLGWALRVGCWGGSTAAPGTGESDHVAGLALARRTLAPGHVPAADGSPAGHHEGRRDLGPVSSGLQTRELKLR